MKPEQTVGGARRRGKPWHLEHGGQSQRGSEEEERMEMLAKRALSPVAGAEQRMGS